MKLPKEGLILKTKGGKTLSFKANVQMRDIGDAPLNNTDVKNPLNDYGQLLIYCKQKDLQGEDTRGAIFRYQGKTWQVVNFKTYNFSPLKENCRLIAETNY